VGGLTAVGTCPDLRICTRKETAGCSFTALTGLGRGGGRPPGDGCGDNRARPFLPCHNGERNSR